MAIWRKLFGITPAQSPPAAPRSVVHASPGRASSAQLGESPATNAGPATPSKVEMSISGKKVSFDPKLVGQLKQDHVNLLAIFQHISSSHQLRAYDQTTKHLYEFKLALQGHVLSENVRFYSYLQSNLLRDSDDAALMHEFRREMNTIIRGVTDFLKAYGGEGMLTRQNHAEFSSQLSQVGAALQQRIDREEQNLYPLYQE